MKKLCLLIFLALVPAFFAGCGNVVATVNGQPVTQKELDKQLEAANGKQMLDNVITQKLVEQDAKAKNITVSDDDVEKQVDEVKKTLAPADQQSLTGDKLQMLKDQIRINLLLEKCIMSSVSQNDIQAYYNKNKDILPEVELSAILVANPKQATAIVDDLKRGVPFATEAQQFSLDPVGREHGGYVGFISKGNLEQISPAAAQAAFSLKPGDVSQPIKTPKGYYILKVMSLKTSFDDLKDEIEKEMAGQRVKTYVQNLHDSAKIDYKGQFASQ